jgi:hypothetical protein
VKPSNIPQSPSFLPKIPSTSVGSYPPDHSDRTPSILSHNSRKPSPSLAQSPSVLRFDPLFHTRRDRKRSIKCGHLLARPQSKTAQNNSKIKRSPETLHSCGTSPAFRRCAVADEPSHRRDGTPSFLSHNCRNPFAGLFHKPKTKTDPSKCALVPTANRVKAYKTIPKLTG